MVPANDLAASLYFYVNSLGLVLLADRRDYPQGRYTLAFLALPATKRRRSN
jgi:catechol 2,3-dioxygenase-like lactoylglutathione lyase family enzyme